MRIIAGEFRGRSLVAPKGLQTRPTSSKVRASFFNSIQPYVDGAGFLDVFSGSGAIGLEALSRGVDHVVFIEKDIEAQRCIKANMETFGIRDRAALLGGDVFLALKRLSQREESFSIIYIDPPYSQPEQVKLGRPLMSIQILQEVDKLHLLQKEGILYIEEASCVEMESLLFENFKYVKRRDFGKTTLFQFKSL